MLSGERRTKADIAKILSAPSGEYEVLYTHQIDLLLRVLSVVSKVWTQIARRTIESVLSGPPPLISQGDWRLYASSVFD